MDNCRWSGGVDTGAGGRDARFPAFAGNDGDLRLRGSDGRFRGNDGGGEEGGGDALTARAVNA